MSRLLSFTLCLAFLTLSACGGIGGGTAESTSPAPMAPTPTSLTLPSDHVLVWSDEFDKAGLPDSTKWGYEVGGNGWGNNYTQGRFAAWIMKHASWDRHGF